MATWKRMAVWFMVTVMCAIGGIIHFRVGVAHLYPMATEQHTGPFTPAVERLEIIVPLSLVLLVLGVGVWAMAGGVQEERARVRGRR